MLLPLYIGNNNLHVAPQWETISQATTLTPIGPLLGGGLAHIAIVGDPRQHGQQLSMPQAISISGPSKTPSPRASPPIHVHHHHG